MIFIYFSGFLVNIFRKSMILMYFIPLCIQFVFSKMLSNTTKQCIEVKKSLERFVFTEILLSQRGYQAEHSS